MDYRELLKKYRHGMLLTAAGWCVALLLALIVVSCLSPVTDTLIDDSKTDTVTRTVTQIDTFYIHTPPDTVIVRLLCQRQRGASANWECHR